MYSVGIVKVLRRRADEEMGNSDRDSTDFETDYDTDAR